MDNPGFQIITKTTRKKTYHGLTFETMKDYIETQPSSEIMLARFAAVKRIAKAKGSLYPSVKEWFLTNYPEYKDSEISDTESEMLASVIAEEALKNAELELANAKVEINADTADIKIV